MELSKPPKDETPLRDSKKLTTRVISVPRAEIVRREAEWKKERAKNGKKNGGG